MPDPSHTATRRDDAPIAVRPKLSSDRVRLKVLAEEAEEVLGAARERSGPKGAPLPGLSFVAEHCDGRLLGLVEVRSHDASGELTLHRRPGVTANATATLLLQRISNAAAGRALATSVAEGDTVLCAQLEAMGFSRLAFADGLGVRMERPSPASSDAA